MSQIKSVLTSNRARTLAVLAVLALTSSAWAADKSSTSSVCADVPHADHPKAMLSNGKLEALVFLPDATNGYYRGARFDWGGVVGCVSLNGHKFFGEWFSKYDPLINDSIVGPVEEFRTDDDHLVPSGHKPGDLYIKVQALGYDEAKPGETFVKLGVGVLRKIDDSPYTFGGAYPVVDTGKRTVRIKKSFITFKQVLHGPQGYAYIYEKTLSLDKNGTTMTLEHHLKNIGTKTIDTQVYDHDFFLFDGRPIGQGLEIRFHFTPEPQGELGPAAKIEGNNIVFQEVTGRHRGVAGYIKGFSSDPADYNFTVEDTNTKVGVQQSSETPLSRFYLWSTARTVAPEGYIHLNIAPGETKSWNIHYRFFAPEQP